MILAVAPDPSTVVTATSDAAAGGLISTVTTVLPVVIPILAAFWGVRFVLRKVGLGKKAAL